MHIGAGPIRYLWVLKYMYTHVNSCKSTMLGIEHAYTTTKFYEITMSTSLPDMHDINYIL